MSDVPFAPSAAVPNPGININLGPQSVSALSQPTAGVSWLPNVSDTAYGNMAVAMNYGQPGENETTTFFESNEPMSYSYVLMPWNDESDQYIVEGTAVFASRYVDRKLNMVNGVTIGKLNHLMKLKHAMFKERAAMPGTEEQKFKDWLQQNDEALLREYDSLLETNRGLANDLAGKHKDLVEMHKLAQKDNCLYESLFGILSRWNFLGFCQSVDGSTGSGDYLDAPQNTQKVNSVGMVVARRARVYNLWPEKGGQIQTGAKLFFVIRRAGGKAMEPFQVETQVAHRRHYVQSGDVFYKSLRTDKEIFTRGFVIYVGHVTTKSNYTSDPEKQLIALGTGAHSLKDCHMACVSLPQIVIQVRV